MANYEDGNIRPLRLEQDKDKTIRYTAEAIDNIYSSNLAGVGKKSLIDGTVDPFDLYIISKLSDIYERFQIDPSLLDENLKQLIRAYNTIKPEVNYHSYLDDIEPTYKSIINYYRDSLIQQGYDPLAASFIVAETPLYPEKFTLYLLNLKYNDDNLKNNVLNYFNTSLQQFKTKYLQLNDTLLEELTEPIILNDAQITEDDLEDANISNVPENDINYYAIQEYTTQDLDLLLGTNLSNITSDNKTFDFSTLTDKDKEILNTLSWYILEKMEILYNSYGRNEQALNHLYDGMGLDLSNIISLFNDYNKDKEDLPLTKIEYLDEHITQYPEIKNLIDKLDKSGFNNLNTILYLNNLINNYNYIDTFGMEGIDTNKLKDDFTHLLQDYETSLATLPVTNDDVLDNDLKKNDELVIVTPNKPELKPTVRYSDNLKWNYTGSRNLLIPLEISPYDAVKMTGAPINARCNGRIRPKNARYGVQKSWHKVAWQGTNLGSATDLYPAPGYTYDDLLKALAHPALVKWANKHGYGILDERPASVRKKTHATGPHLHFGPNKVKLGDCPLILKYKTYWESLGYTYE